MRWFALTGPIWPVSRSKRIDIGKTGRLTLESLEERQCFASDTFIETSLCSQFPEAQHEMSPLAMVELGSSYITTGSEEPNEYCGDESDEPDEAGPLVGESPVVFPIESDSLILGNQPHTGELPVVGESAADRNGSTSSSISNPPLEEQIVSKDFVYGPTAGQAASAVAPDRVGSSGSNSLDSDVSSKWTLPNTTTTEPVREPSASRPLIHKVETLLVSPRERTLETRERTLGMGSQSSLSAINPVPSSTGTEINIVSSNANRSALAFSNVKSESVRTKTDQVKTELMVEPVASFGRERERPNIANVVALTPILATNDANSSARSVASWESQLKRLIPNKAVQVSVRTLSIKGEVGGGVAHIFSDEELNGPAKAEPKEKEPAEKDSSPAPLNPLYFVVLVGLSGLPQSVRNRVAKKSEDRDNSHLPGPIEIEPLVGEFEPGAKNNF